MKKLITLILGIALVYSCSTSSDGNGNSTTTVVPIAPSSLTGTVASSTQINLSWTDNSTNETGFKIERKTGTENYAVVGTTAADITTFNNSVLSPNTTYKYRVYSNNAVGNSLTYSNELTLTTINTIIIPTLITTVASSISNTTAISGGTISSDGGATITARGIVWGTSSSPIIILPTKTSDGTGIGSFTSAISGLTSNTTYYIRAYATNSVGTAYGNQYSFTTTASILPAITTTALSSITTTTAVSGGSISSDGGALITARGVCWSISPNNPTIALSTKTIDGTGTGQFTSSISGLLVNNTYKVRAYATNSAGTKYGDVFEFHPLPVSGQSLSDIDGNVYQTVIICNQTWTTTNLNVSKYRNGDVIPQVTDATQWLSLNTGAWCYNNNDPANGTTYGKLYNWYAGNDPRGLAPIGYHVPTRNDYETLFTCLNNYYARKMREAGTMHWINGLGTNSSGFTALPGSTRNYYGLFGDLGYGCYLWCSTDILDSNGIRYGDMLEMMTQDGLMVNGQAKINGMSVRLVKD